MDKPTKHAGGRPTKFTKDMVEQVKKLCALGATDDDLADFFNVHRATINRWKINYPEFCDALKVSKAELDHQIERTLYHKARGFTFTEQQAFKVKVSRDEERIEIVDVQRMVPPDTTSMIFWLKNRKSDEWRDKMDHSIGGGETPIEFKNTEVTKEQVIEKLKELGLPTAIYEK